MISYSAFDPLEDTERFKPLCWHQSTLVVTVPSIRLRILKVQALIKSLASILFVTVPSIRLRILKVAFDEVRAVAGILGYSAFDPLEDTERNSLNCEK